MSPQTPKLLVVDRDPAFIEQVRQGLAAKSWVVVEARNGQDAVEKSKQEAPDVILLDVSLDTPHNQTVASLLKLDPLTCRIPIVLVSTMERSDHPREPWVADAVPRSAALPLLVAKLQEVVARHTAQRPYILVVDDEPDLVDILTTMLGQAGFATSSAVDGREALDLMRAVKPDALLLDLDMPRVNGWEVLGILRSAPGLGDVRVVILTGKDQTPEDRRRGLELGAADYLLKPCALDDIVRALQAALREPPPPAGTP